MNNLNFLSIVLDSFSQALVQCVEKDEEEESLEFEKREPSVIFVSFCCDLYNWLSQ